MTRQRQIIRLFIIGVATIGLAFGVRELYYFRSMQVSRVMAKVELPELIQNSPLIVKGTVEKSIGTARYSDPSGELVVGTRWQVTVNELLKGQAPDSIVVRTLGGRYGLTVMWMEDEVEFTDGETSILFLEPDPSGQDYRVVDMYQGHYRIQNDQVIQQESGETKLLSELEAMIKKPAESVN